MVWKFACGCAVEPVGVETGSDPAPGQTLEASRKMSEWGLATENNKQLKIICSFTFATNIYNNLETC